MCRDYSIFSAVSILLVLMPCPLCMGAFTPTPPFLGEIQESWENFNAFRNPESEGGFLSSPVRIFDSKADFSNSALGIFEAQTSSSFNLDTSGEAQPADGFKGAGTEGASPSTVIFDVPVRQFGGYWGAATTSPNADPAVLQFDFFGTNDQLLGTDYISYSRSFTAVEEVGIFFADGMLNWAGWEFSEAVSKIIIRGEVVANDFLQANSIPEPNAVILLLAGCLLFQGRLRRIRKQ